MTENRKITVQPPPSGFVWAKDYESEDGSVVIPGIATRLGITYSTYRKWRMRDEGPPVVRIGGKKIAARIEAIEAYLDGLHQAAVDEAQAAQAEAKHDSRPAELRHAPRNQLTQSAA